MGAKVNFHAKGREAGNVRTISLPGVDIDCDIRGEGRDILYLPGGHWLAEERTFIDRLATLGRVATPEFPGFSARPAPGRFNCADDLAYVCLDLVAALKMKNILLVGANFGGWVAAEIATKACADFSALALIDPYGVRTGAREERDIVDLFALPDPELKKRAWADPSRFDENPRNQTDAELARRVRAREAFARYGWAPFMHNPKLNGRLHRAPARTLFLWGAQDRIVSPEHVKKFTALVPGAQFRLIEGAGHFPHVEQADRTLDAIAAFARGA